MIIMFKEISDFSIFSEIPKDEIDSILLPLKIRHLKKNHILLFENDIREHVFFISSGILKIYRMHEGQEIILGIISPGDIIGEIEILTGMDYLISSAEVLDDATAFVMSKQDFVKIVESYPSIYKYAYAILADRFRVVNRLVRYLAFYDVRRKVANLLMDLYYNFGETSLNNGMIELKLNQTTFANMLGISRESVSTTLADFREEGIIDIRNKHYFIVDKKKLDVICDGAEEMAIHRKWRNI